MITTNGSFSPDRPVSRPIPNQPDTVLARWHSRAPQVLTALVISIATAVIAPTAAAISSTAPDWSSFEPRPADDDWLSRINQIRNQSGLDSVTADASGVAGLEAHLRYLELTPSSYFVGEYVSRHTENPDSPYYTEEGDSAGRKSNLAGGVTRTPIQSIDAWLAAPFHAVGILRPNLESVSFAASTSPGGWSALDVISGLTNDSLPTETILMPGSGSQTVLTRFTAESPNPLETCPGIQEPSLPLIMMLPDNPPPNLAAQLVRPDGLRQQLCVISEHTYRTTDSVHGPTGKAILDSDDAVFLIADGYLTTGHHEVIVNGLTPQPQWEFDVFGPPATLGSPLVTEATTTSLTMTWEPADDATDYSVIVQDDHSNEVATCSTTSTSCRADHLAPDTSYLVEVTANNPAGASSPSRIWATTEPTSTPDVPTTPDVPEPPATTTPLDVPTTPDVTEPPASTTVGGATTIEELIGADDFTELDAGVLRLYQAFFDRGPDLDGARYWIDLRRNGVVHEDDLAYGFGESTEFVSRYGRLADEEFLMLMYQNMLDRAPDQGGFDYWLGKMTSGELDQYSVVRWVVANDEFINKYPFGA